MLTIISNASPLIGLARIEKLDILRKLWSEIVIPEAVYRETVIRGSGKHGADIIEDACREWIQVVSVKNRSEVEALQAMLDEGEAEVVTLGQEMDADLVLLDNREPRMFARTVNLKVIGTIGIIIMAWQKGLLKEPLEVINKLKANGFWIADQLLKKIDEDIKKQN